MAKATKMLVNESESSYTLEFRAYKDDAWYTVLVLLEAETLIVKYFNFSDENDNVFHASDFRDQNHVEEFERRFRPLSKQVQDSECCILAKGVRVCACQCFGDDDLRFYDAVVDGVQKSKHSWKEGEELCLCMFILFWIQGPNAGNLTVVKIEDICVVQPEQELDPVVASFLEMAREKIGSLSSIKGVSRLEMMPNWIKSSNNSRGIGYCEQIEKERRCARCSAVEVCSSKVGYHDMEDRDLEGTKNVCMILIANIDKVLCPSTITEFLHRHTSVSASVFIFPSLLSELYTRGAIILDSKIEFQVLCDFLSNPNCIVTSSTGRPWVILEKLVGLKKIKASIGALVHVSKNKLQKEKSGRKEKLKVVRSGTKEFKKASEMRDLFVAFSDHQERLHKRLAFEETRVSAADEH